jgi:hypothetical protein
MSSFAEALWCCLAAAIFICLLITLCISHPKTATKPVTEPYNEPKRACEVCTEQLPGWHFPPIRITATCNHNANVCKVCLREWLHNCIEVQGKGEVRCPTCAELLSYEDVSRWSNKEAFKKYFPFLHFPIILLA